MGGIAGQGSPASGGEASISVLKSLWGSHDPIFEMTPFLIAGPVEREKNPLAQFRGFFEQDVDDVTRRGLEPRNSIELTDVEQLMQNEIDIAQRCTVGCHGPVPRVVFKSQSNLPEAAGK